MGRLDQFRDRAALALEEATGRTVVETERLTLLEAAYEDYRVQTRQLEDIGWTVLNYMGGSPQEMTPQARLAVVQRARYVWMNDPQAGAAVELMNDFVFGRGVPRPRAKDKVVQEAIDEAWDDPDNQEVLCKLESQLALGTDLSLQSNFFLLMFGDESDTSGPPKLSILRHDDVTNAVVDPDRRHRVLWYVARTRRLSYDFESDRYVPDPKINVKPLYYAHWRNVELAYEEDDVPDRETPLTKPADDRIGDGKVYHARINRYSEQVFGVPRFQRTLRWYGAYNQYVKDRLDIVSAAAALIMKRKTKGTAATLARDAAKMLSTRGTLASGLDGGGPIQPGMRSAGGIIVENESTDHEPFNLDTRAGNAAQDAQIIRAPISAAERWTQAYFGDTSSSSLATATSLELPILKAVEARQEVFEGIFRWFIDRVIQKAVDSGQIPEVADPLEDTDEPTTKKTVAPDVDDADDSEDAMEASLLAALDTAVLEEAHAGRDIVGAHIVKTNLDREIVVLVSKNDQEESSFRLVEALEDKSGDEEATERDLGYEFSMPSPLRRMMTDLIGAVQMIATTFDPNNTNVELSRALLTIALGEGLEVQDPADLVDQILPKDWKDPMVAAAEAAAAGAAATPMSSGDQAFPSGPDSNPYGAPMNATRPENMRSSGAYQATEAVFRSRAGDPIVLRSVRRLVVDRTGLEEHFADLPEPDRRNAEGNRDEELDLFEREVVAAGLGALDRTHLLNGNGKEPK